MIIKKIIIKNFMSVGNDQLEIDFDNYNGIILITGENLSISKNSSNGSGKSLLYEAILFALYEKTIRGLSKDECINFQNGKNLYIELYVDDLMIIRQRKPNKLSVYKKNNDKWEDITRSSMQITQKELENIIGINYETFINIFCFGQHNLFSFLSADNKTKRIIIENLLSLEEYKKYEDNTKNYIKIIKNNIFNYKNLYENNNDILNDKNNQINVYQNKLKDFKDNLLKEIDYINEKLEEINKIDVEKELENWKKYEKNLEEYTILQNKIYEINNEINFVKNKLNPLLLEIKNTNSDIDRIKNFENGYVCKQCFSVLDNKHSQKVVPKLMDKKNKLLDNMNDDENKLSDLLKKENKMKKMLYEKKQNIELKPDYKKEILYDYKSKKDNCIKELDKKNKEINENPYYEIIENINKEIEDIKKEIEIIRFDIDEREEILEYLKFWSDGFGDSGIKSFIIENIINTLNNKINYWLQFLINNKIIIKFDKYLNVNIKRELNNEEMLYKQCSGGEEKRIDLAISFAFAHIIRMNSNKYNNIIFLDELAESLDSDGIESVYNALLELSKTNLVFIITHNLLLLEKLKKCKNLHVIKNIDGFTKLS